MIITREMVKQKLVHVLNTYTTAPHITSDDINLYGTMLNGTTINSSVFSYVGGDNKYRMNFLDNTLSIVDQPDLGTSRLTKPIVVHNIWGFECGKVVLVGNHIGGDIIEACEALGLRCDYMSIGYSSLNSIAGTVIHNFHRMYFYKYNPVFSTKKEAQIAMDDMYKQEIWVVSVGDNKPQLLHTEYNDSWDKACQYCAEHVMGMDKHIVGKHFVMGIGELEFGGNPLFSSKEKCEEYINRPKPSLLCRLFGGNPLPSKILNQPTEREYEYDVWVIKPISKVPMLFFRGTAKSWEDACEKARSGVGQKSLVKGVDTGYSYNGNPAFLTEEYAIAYINSKLKKSYSSKMPKSMTVTVEMTDENRKALKSLHDHVNKINKPTFIFGCEWATSSDWTGYLPKQKTPKLIDVTSLPYFGEVASVVGNARAIRDIRAVIDTPECHDDIRNEELDMAFTWNMTPQGDEYWANIEAQIQDLRDKDEQDVIKLFK